MYGVGYFVGMVVYDVGDYDVFFEFGMVIVVELIIELIEYDLYICIEDMVFIIKGEFEILSVEVLKELEDVLVLVGKRVGK